MPLPSKKYNELFRPTNQSETVPNIADEQVTDVAPSDDDRTHQLSLLASALGNLLSDKLEATAAGLPEQDRLKDNPLVALANSYIEEILLPQNDTLRENLGMITSDISPEDLINESVDAALELVRQIHINGSPKSKRKEIMDRDRWDMLAYDNPSRIGALGGLLYDKYARASRDPKLAKEVELAMIGIDLVMPYYLTHTVGSLDGKPGLKYFIRSMEKIKASLIEVIAGPNRKILTRMTWQESVLASSFDETSEMDFLLSDSARFTNSIFDRMLTNPDYVNELCAGLETFLAEEEKEAPLQTDWVILQTGGDGMPRTESDHPKNGTTVEPFVDSTRITFLRDLVKTWGKGYVAEGLLKGSGRKHSYYVAVLVDANGEEHVVADCEEGSSNGIYMHRGDNEAGLTWMQVFDGNKNRALGLGARMVKHTGEKRVEGKVLDLLTRPIDQWKNPKYTY